MKTFQLEIVTPDGPTFRGPVERLVLPAEEGLMGVEPGHEPMLVLMGPGPLHFVAEGATQWLAVSGGFAKIARDRVVLLAETAELAAAIDVSRAKAQAGLKQQALSAPRGGGLDHVALEAGLMKELVRLKVAQKAPRS